MCSKGLACAGLKPTSRIANKEQIAYFDEEI